MTNAARKKRFRTQWLIYPKFQLTLIAANLACLTVVFGGVAILIAQATNRLHQMSAAINIPVQHPYYLMIEQQRGVIFGYLSLAFLGSAVLVSVATLLISHRLAGPIVRMRGFFRAQAEGIHSPRELTFRKGDFFAELPPLVNAALHRARQAK